MDTTAEVNFPPVSGNRAATAASALRCMSGSSVVATGTGDIPGYLAYLAGLVGADAPAVSTDEPVKAGRWRVVGASGLFVLGFTVVFTIGTVTLFGLTDLLLLNQELNLSR